MNRLLAHLVIVMLLLPAHVFASDNSFKITYLINRAVDRNLDLQALQLEANAQRSRADQAGRLDDISLQLGYDKREEPVGNTNLGSVGFSQNFSRPGRLRAKENAALAEAKLKDADHQISETELKGRVLELIYIYKVATDKAIHAKERFERFRTVQSYLKSRPFAAPKSRAEAMIVRSKLLVLQKEMRELQSNQRIAWNNLNLYLGLPSEPEIRVPWYKTAPAFDPSILEKKAEKASPEIKRQSLRVSIQEGELQVAKFDSWQGFTLNGSFTYGGGADPERDFMLGVSVPLPLWNANRGAIAASESKRAAEEARLKWAREKMNSTLKSALEHYRLTSSTIKDLSPDRIAEQERDMRDVDNHFKKGQVDLITYIEADAEHFDSLNAILDAQLDFVSALRELLFLAGEAPQPLEI